MLLASLLGAMACGGPSPEANEVAFGVPYSAGHRALIKAWRSSYPPVACLSGGLPVASVPVHVDSEQQDLRRRAALQVETEAKQATTAHSLATKGILLLLLQDPDVAVETLRRATLEPDCPPAVWSDLGVALLIRAQIQSDSYDLVGALTATQRALAHEPHMLQALFNRSVILEELQLRGAAVAARRMFLEHCRQSTWCDVARRRLHKRAMDSLADNVRQALRQAATGGISDSDLRNHVLAAPQTARIYLEEELLTGWADEIASGRGKGQQRRWLGIHLGNQLLAATGDRLPREEAACLDFTGSKRILVLTGLQAYQGALSAYRRFEIERAETGFDRAAQFLDRADCPLSRWATFYWTVCRYYRKDLPAAEKSFEALEHFAGQHGYVNLAGRAAWMRGLVAATLSRPADALSHYQRALEHFSSTREEGSQGALHSMIAGAAHHLGDPRAEWSHRVQALRLLNRYGDRERLNMVLSAIALDLASSGEISSAILVQNEVVALLRSNADPTGLAEALWLRSRLHARAGAEQPALADLEEARHESVKVDSPALQEHLKALIGLAQGTLKQTRQPEAAVGILDQVAAYAERRLPVLIGEVLLQRARARIALGQFDQAAADLKRAILEVEHRRAEVDDDSERIGFFGQSRELFEEMVLLQWDRRQDRLAALEFADRAKARGLLDRVANAPKGKTLPLAALDAMARSQASSPGPSGPRAVATFAFEKNRGLGWISTRDGWSGWEIALNRDQLAAATMRLRAAVTRGEERKADEILHYLSTLLFHPVWSELHGIQRLVVVPDSSLSLVPFAALTAPDGKRFVEHFEVVVVPSLAVMQELAARASRRRPLPTAHTALVVASPQIDHTRYPYLSNLGSSPSEAREVAAAYPSALLLAGSQATPAALARVVSQATTLHLAVHAVVDERHPEHSRLVLATGEGSNGDLKPEQIARLDLSGTRLVVLAACSTSTGGEAPLEGVLDLARPFLAAGAPEVVTTLWDLNDRDAQWFFASFHRRFAHSLDAAAALRATQLEVMDNPSRPKERLAAWAGFQIIGVTKAGEPNENLRLDSRTHRVAATGGFTR